MKKLILIVSLAISHQALANETYECSTTDSKHQMQVETKWNRAGLGVIAELTNQATGEKQIFTGYEVFEPNQESSFAPPWYFNPTLEMKFEIYNDPSSELKLLFQVTKPCPRCADGSDPFITSKVISSANLKTPTLELKMICHEK